MFHHFRYERNYLQQISLKNGFRVLHKWESSLPYYSGPMKHMAYTFRIVRLILFLVFFYFISLFLCSFNNVLSTDYKWLRMSVCKWWIEQEVEGSGFGRFWVGRLSQHISLISKCTIYQSFKHPVYLWVEFSAEILPFTVHSTCDVFIGQFSVRLPFRFPWLSTGIMEASKQRWKQDERPLPF